MSYKQLKKADPTVRDGYGWCLRMTRRVFGVGAHYATAWDAWEGAKHRSTSRTMPNVAVPVFFSYTGTFNGVRKNWGHVVAYIPGRGFLSSPASGTGQLWAKSIAEMERLIPGSKYVGWALDLNNVLIAKKATAKKPSNVVSGKDSDMTIYIRRNQQGKVYAYSPQTGAKRGLSTTEWNAIKRAYGAGKLSLPLIDVSAKEADHFGI